MNMICFATDRIGACSTICSHIHRQTLSPSILGCLTYQTVLLIVVLVIENVRLRACTKTGTILTNTIQFLFESYPILM